MHTFKDEPVAIAGFLTAVGTLAIPALRLVNVDIDHDATNIILLILTAIVVVLTVLVRDAVIPVHRIPPPLMPPTAPVTGRRPPGPKPDRSGL